MTQSGSLRPLRSAGFRYFLAARTVSLFGNAMAPVAIAFAVLQIGGSAGDLGLVLAARRCCTCGRGIRCGWAWWARWPSCSR
jgi:hypothetical protein